MIHPQLYASLCYTTFYSILYIFQCLSVYLSSVWASSIYILQHLGYVVANVQTLCFSYSEIFSLFVTPADMVVIHNKEILQIVLLSAKNVIDNLVLLF